MSAYSTDPLVILAACRRSLVSLKARDFAAERLAQFPRESWGSETPEAYNASQRSFYRRMEVFPRYELARLRAMRPTCGLAMADMLAMAARCENASDAAVASWRAAA